MDERMRKPVPGRKPKVFVASETTEAWFSLQFRLKKNNLGGHRVSGSSTYDTCREGTEEPQVLQLASCFLHSSCDMPLALSSGVRDPLHVWDGILY